MTEFLFVRHGESTGNLTPERICGRSNDLPLTDRGREQARLLGEYLGAAKYFPDIIVSSGAIRANKTAELATTAAGLLYPIHIDERLQEVSQGPYEGQPRSEVYTPEAVELYQLNESLRSKLPGAESIAEAQERMLSFVGDAYRLLPNGTVLVFGHGLAIRALVGALMNSSREGVLESKTPNVSLTSITVADGQAHVNYLGKPVISE